jgi:streptogramin lyase
MHPLPRIAVLALTALPVLAQEGYWVANRASSDIMKISPWGSVLARVATPTTLRGLTVAPDGKVWIVRFIQSTFDIYDPATNTITPVTSQLGSPYEIAFDAQGNAWISGGTGVQQFSASGAFIQSYPLTAAAPLGITVDTTGNKWIAHRTSPASVSRIDPNGVVTNYPLVGVTTQPTKIIADYRGFQTASHMWVVGDGTAQLLEIDDQGTLLNNYALPITSVGSVCFDKNGDIWVGSFGNGALLRIDRNTGGVLGTFSVPPNILGLSCDSYGRILTVARVTFSGVGPPCEVRRVDPATGLVEVPTLLQSGSFNASGTQWPVSTPFQYAMVVSQLGDMDGDGEVNYLEALNGTSPIDPLSSSVCSVNTTGVTSIGSTGTFGVQTGAGSFWLLTFSFGLVAPGSGITLPGFGGELLLDPLLGLGVTVSGVGSAGLALSIPNDPSYQGQQWFTQGFVVGGATVQFTNVSGMKFW